MEIRAEFKKFNELETDALVVMVCEAERADEGLLSVLDQCSGGVISEVIGGSEMKGKQGDLVYLHRPGQVGARRLLLAGAGKRDRLSLESLSRVAGTAARFLRGKGAQSVGLLLRQDFDLGRGAEVAVQGVMLGLFEPDTYRTQDKDDRRLETLVLIAEAGQESAVRQGLDRGRIIAEAINLARDLSNEPSSTLTPTVLAERAREVAIRVGLEIDILDQDRMQELGMGALLGVARGSDEPPKLVVLQYNPRTSDDNSVVAIVGKGITFDSGGISIKPADGMEKMKYDMSGAAATLAAMSAIAQLKPNVRVMGLMPASENMPSGHAYKPGDVLRAMDGKTIEVVNTDAEGRLILADAIAYSRKLGATEIIDLATLTGAVSVALGSINVGVMGNNQALIDRVRSSAQRAGERFWQLPMDDEYRELIRSDIADMKNSGGRSAGTISAAQFLREFAGDIPWVHLDIAGTAWENDRKPYMAKGPTGVAIRTLIEFLCSHGTNEAG
jgi:leucyl aminopeptidase